MSHDVFISHSSIDKNIADAVCAALEDEGIRCWIAPRDIRPGDSWGASIIKGIEESRAMVIVFSTNSNESKQVMREVERAIQKNVVVVPFRIDGVEPSADMEYFLSATHWLDAKTPEMDAHLAKLSATVKSILNKSTPENDTRTIAAPVPLKAEPAKPKEPSKLGMPLFAGAGFILLILLGGLWLWLQSGSEDNVVVDTATGDGNIRIALPERAIGAESIEVEVTGTPAEKDYLVVGKSDSQDSSYLKKANVEGREKVSLEVPDKEGLYEVRYFDGTSKTVVARQALKVSAPEVTLDAVDSSLAGTEIDVTWSAPNHKGDYLAIAEKGAVDSKYVFYAYTSKGSPTRIRVPTVEGSYEIRYISAQSKTAWARRDFEALKPEASIEVPESAIVGADVVVDWTGPAVKGDYVTIAEPESEGKKYVSYKYAKKGQKLVLRMPDDAGTYEVRYISGGSYAIRDSAPIEVKAANVEIAKVEDVEVGKEFVVKWTGPGYKSDYIGIFNPTDINGKYLSYQYASKGNALRFTAPKEPGTYELKYISGQKKREWAAIQFIVKAVEEEEAQ